MPPSPEMKVFSRANLMSMRAFAEAWPDLRIVQQAVGQLPWGHNLPSIEQLEKELGLWAETEYASEDER